MTQIELKYCNEFHILLQQGELTGDWSNVYQHCLTEARVAEITGDLLQLPEGKKIILIKAAILHDWYKRKEREAVIAGGFEKYNDAGQDSYDKLLALGVDKHIVDIAHSVGHTAIDSVTVSTDLLRRAMFFIDLIVSNTDIVSVDQRMDNLEALDRYKELNESGRKIYNGRTYF